MLKSNSLKFVVFTLVIFMLVESISGIIGKSKGKRKKHKDDSDDYDDDDQSCYPGRNCVPGCYCSGEECRPYFPPKNHAEAKLKCKTFNYPQWSISKKKKGKGKHKHKKHHHEKSESEADISSLVTKHNFTAPQAPLSAFAPIEIVEIVPTQTVPVSVPVPAPVQTFGELDVKPQNSSYSVMINNVSYQSPIKAVHPSQRNFRL